MYYVLVFIRTEIYCFKYILSSISLRSIDLVYLFPEHFLYNICFKASNLYPGKEHCFWDQIFSLAH